MFSVESGFISDFSTSKVSTNILLCVIFEFDWSDIPGYVCSFLSGGPTLDFS